MPIESFVTMANEAELPARRKYGFAALLLPYSSKKLEDRADTWRVESSSKLQSVRASSAESFLR